MKVGYHRVSSAEQNRAREDLGTVDRVFQDKGGGKDADRTQLLEMIALLGKGDEVVVHSIDWLARDLRDLRRILTLVNDKGASVEFLSEGLVFSGDRDSELAQLQLKMIDAMAAFERNIIRKRQAVGIERARAKGVYDNRSVKNIAIKNRGADVKANGS